MKKPLAIIVILIIAIAGIAIFTLSKNSQKEPVNMAQKDDARQSQDTTDKIEGSRYQEYSKSTFDKAASTKRVLFFYANWCPTCRPADKNFRENSSKIPTDVTLIRVNYNDSDTDQEEKDLASTYNVTYQHTYVQIDPDGDQVTKWNGGQIEQFLANIK